METYLLTNFARSGKFGATNFWREAPQILVSEIRENIWCFSLSVLFISLLRNSLYVKYHVRNLVRSEPNAVLNILQFLALRAKNLSLQILRFAQNSSIATIFQSIQALRASKCFVTNLSIITI